MKAFLSIFSFLFITSQAFCGWVPVSTGIVDDFTAISYENGTGLITGKKGVYISTNGGTTAGSWSRAESYLTPSDSIIYNHSQLYDCVSSNSSSIHMIYFCGRDTINASGVIFAYNTVTQKIQLIHSSGQVFYKLAAKTNSNHIYAVGNNGILLYFSEANPIINLIPTTYSFDLKSINIYLNSLVIGTDDYVIQGTINSTSPGVISFGQSYYPNRNFKDFLIVSTGNVYGVGKNLFKITNVQESEPHQYYVDSLKGNSILYRSNQLFYGTDNGIYRSASTGTILEFQPTSSGYKINSIYPLTSPSLIACGNNGTILYSTDGGGTVEPYAQIDYNGGCLGIQQSISSTKGTVTSCSNYIDNVLITSTCSNYGYTFNTPGSHQIKLIVSNGSYSKTITKTITIVAPPQINLPTDVLDTILCKQGVLDITIHNSENGIFYTLFKFGSATNYGISGNGNGSDLDFQSILLNQATIFYVRATNSAVPGCYKNFTDTISITVEKPVSKIYFDVINAEVNEDVRFYQRSVNATNFEWQFTNSPTLSTSNSPTPVNSFTGLGSSQVTLIAGTNNNCYDTTTIRGPFIYQPYTTDSSWIFRNKIVTPGTQNQSLWNDIKKTIKSKNGGYLVMGNYADRIIMSRVGDSVNCPAQGGYLAKYNDFGILKWCIRATPFGTSGGTGFSELYKDLMEDSHGNIFMVGANPTNSLVDNKGDSIAFNQSFVVKLDSLGNTIWYRSSSVFYNFSMHSLAHDYNDDIYVSCGFSNNSTPVQLLSAPFFLNGLPHETLTNSGNVCNYCMLQGIVIKLDSQSGEKVYDFLIESSGSFGANLVFDTLNNLYLYGNRQSHLIIHEPSGIDTFMLNLGNPNNELYICKFDSGGNHVWKFNGTGDISSLKVSEQGDLYFTGSNSYNTIHPFNSMEFTNADNSTSNFTGGHLFIAKVNSNGMTQWINGNYNSYYAWGVDILLDNDSLYVLGSVHDNDLTTGSTYVQCEMLGQNNLSVPINSDKLCYFIAKYDLDGTISNVYLSQPTGASNGFDLSSVSNANLIRLDDGYFLMVKSVWLFNPNLSQPDGSDFGHTLDYTSHTNGIHLKFQPDEGIVFNPHYFKLIIDSVCYNSSYTFLDGSVVSNITAPFVQVDSLVASNGMDSIIKYQITVPLVNESYQYITVCQGGDYELPNDTTFTNIQSDFFYTQTFSFPNACDSLANYQFFVTPPPSASVIQVIHACQGEDLTLPDGSTINNIQGNQFIVATLQNVNGCDSLANYLIQVTMLNATITPVGNDLSTSGSGSSTYQWVNCNTSFSPISGATGMMFTPTSNGNYAIIVNENGCADTSACYQYTNLSINELDQSISVFPNPTSGKALITFENTIGFATISVYSNDGRKVLDSPIQGIEKYELDLSSFEKGTYFVRIAAESKNSEFVIVKN